MLAAAHMCLAYVVESYGHAATWPAHATDHDFFTLVVFASAWEKLNADRLRGSACVFRYRLTTN